MQVLPWCDFRKVGRTADNTTRFEKDIHTFERRPIREGKIAKIKTHTAQVVLAEFGGKLILATFCKRLRPTSSGTLRSDFRA